MHAIQREIGGFVLGCCGVGVAAGDTVEDTDAERLRSSIEVIVIEGERGERIPLEDTSHSITVFTELHLERDTDLDMADLFQRIPNVTTDPFSGDLIIRGVAHGGVGRSGVRGSVNNTVAYFDGFFTSVPQNLWDARQVEVLRGPESYMSGGAMGGITAVHSKDVGETVDGRLMASWSPDPDERELGLAYGGPVTDTLGYRISAYTRERDGFYDNVTRDDDAWNGRDERVLRGKVEWRPAGSDETVVTLRAERLENDSDGNNFIVGGPGIGPFERETFSNQPEHDDLMSTTANIEVDHRLDDRWSTQVRGLWIRSRFHGEGDFDGAAEPIGRYEYDFDQEWAGASVRLFYDDGPWQGFFRQYALRLDQVPADNLLFFPFDLDSADDIPGVELAVRIFQPSPDWWFIGTQIGARRELGALGIAASVIRAGQSFDGSRRGQTFYREGSTGDPAADIAYDEIFATFFPSANVSDDLDNYNYLPNLVIDYALTEETTIGAKFERTARLAGVWFNLARGTLNGYDDEYADSYDLFMRSSWLDGKLGVRANAFYTELTDQQVFVALSSEFDDGEILNAPRSHNYGVELEIDWNVGAWSFWCSGGLLHAEFDDFAFFDVDFSGNDFPNAPEWTLGFGFVYGDQRGLFAEMDATFRPETVASLENLPGVVNERRSLFNGRVGWAFERVEVSVFGRNLLDDEYLEFHDPDLSFGGARPVYLVGDPREIGVSISVSL